MVKETIRLGFTELGNFLFATGQYSPALKQFTRCRDYATATKHVTEMAFNVIKVAIEMDNWVLVQSYVAKAESTFESVPHGAADPDAKIRAKATCCSGLALMASSDFAGAARAFLGVKFDNSSDFPELMSARDVGIYGGLAALATFDRKQVKEKVIENTSFKEFLELVPEVREVIKAFYSSKYASCLSILEKMKPDLLLDIFLQPHIGFLYRRIRERALVQYFSPFRSVDMATMAKAFSCGVASLEAEVIELINSGSIQARIDSDKKILYARTVDQRTQTFTEAFELGRQYEIHSKALLLRVAMAKANMAVRLREGGRDRGGGGGGAGGKRSDSGGMQGMMDDRSNTPEFSMAEGPRYGR